MNELALFSGGGGGVLGGKLLGWRTRCAVEINPYARSVLLARQRDGCLNPFPIWDNVETFSGEPWRGSIDIVTGGFPCVDVSHFGSRSERLGIKGKRSGLWSHMARIVKEVGPSFVFIENTPQIRYRGLDIVIQDLAEMGFDCAWDIFSAKEFGAPHERKRLWCLARNPNRPYACKVEKVQSQNSKLIGNSWWTKECESRIPRMANGVANRVDRFYVIGNGQLPIVAYNAFIELRKQLDGRLLRKD